MKTEPLRYGINSFCRPGDLPGNYGIRRVEVLAEVEGCILEAGKKLSRAARLPWPCDDMPTFNWLKHVNIVGACALLLKRADLQEEFDAAVVAIKAGEAPHQLQPRTEESQDADPEAPPELAEGEQSVV
uniref:Uncharacterized protein n=1 Tax=viral metagenome TaxID=1070528 RepID=A0A6M3J0U9_9ZZZZ